MCQGRSWSKSPNRSQLPGVNAAMIPQPSQQVPASMARDVEVKATLPGELLRVMSAAHRRKLCLRGVLLFALDVGVYSLMLACICVLPGWWLKALAVFSAGFVISRLFGLAHDAAHNNLTPSPRLNRWIARWAFFPALTPLTSWMFDHHVRHHAHLRIRGKDTTWPPLSLAEYRARSPLGRWWYRFLRTPLGMGPYWIFEYW